MTDGPVGPDVSMGNTTPDRFDERGSTYRSNRSNGIRDLYGQSSSNVSAIDVAQASADILQSLFDTHKSRSSYKQTTGAVDLDLMAQEDDMDIDDSRGDDAVSGPERSYLLPPQHENILAENAKDFRSPASQAMSISAMLSNPIEPAVLSSRPPEQTAVPTKSTRTKTPRKKLSEDTVPARKTKARSAVSQLTQASSSCELVLTQQSDTRKRKEEHDTRRRKDDSDTRKRKDGRNKPRIVPDSGYDLENALYDSDESEVSDDEQYEEARARYRSESALKFARITAAEDVCQRRRRLETTSRLLGVLDRRARKVQKSFEERHHREALTRATAEEAYRKEEQRRKALCLKKQAKAVAKDNSMAPPSTGRKSSSKKRKRDRESIANKPQLTPGVPEKKPERRESTPFDATQALQEAIFKEIARKEVPKVYRIIQSHHSNRSLNLRKTGQLCAKEARRWQVRTNKTAKDMQAKSKRAMREMLVFWKRNERGDLLNRQKAEKEIIDRAKKEEESRESRRQARKLNFLITQTELYSHFIGSKVKTSEAEQSEETAGDARLQERPSVSVPLIEPDALPGAAETTDLDFDADDDDALRAAAARNAQYAVQKAKAKAQGFDTESGARAKVSTGDAQANVDAMDLDFQNPTTLGEAQVSQPKMLNATLKEYQLKGLNWLVNLYEQGINGILADEMGLGKTVQSISVMAHLAETYDIWGPFLVIAPASTLHNWQQEISKFVPRLKALPYWGNSKDRKVLRKFWDRKRATYSEDAPFHVVVTSYQLVVLDSQYFQNVKWQYMILDEAQAIKSSQSSRWKNLLGFKCRNRLLLTGTPIQNTMQELWALLHFIMPSLFDSHNEFSEWFSKDIENHAQKNSELNESQLKRLHMILKPFMLRRVKKNVQKELGDKIELDVFCDLNMRQRSIYSLLRREISMKDILEKATSDRDADLSTLMNLVMQLRKVCNHPDLFERADVRTPLALVDMPKTANLAKEGQSLELRHASTSAIKYHLPKFLYRHGGLLDVPSDASSAGSRKHLLHNVMNIFTPENIKTSEAQGGGAFDWRIASGLSIAEVCDIHRDGLRCIIKAKNGSRKRQSPRSGALFSPRDMLRIIESHNSSDMDVNLGDVMGSLLNVRKTITEFERVHRLEPMYDPSVLAPPVEILCPDRTFVNSQASAALSDSTRTLLFGLSLPEESAVARRNLYPDESILPGGIYPAAGQERRGYNNIRIPSMQTFITDSGKLSKLDQLLSELKKNDHRVLLYFQMTKMIDLMEEYLVYRQYKYLRLDGSSKISDRRDMVSDWQTRPELFVFLLSTRAGGLGINLTAADTVIFYDSDWNPTIDSQAMDRAHRLGQTKQVTVYRLITRGTIEERILSRAKEKEEVQKVVISGGDYKQSTTENIQFQAQKGGGRDVVSWLLEDDDQVKKVAQQLDSMPNKSKKHKQARQGPTLDELYHEGESKMSDVHSPDVEFGDDEPAKDKKKSSSKKKARVD